MENYAAIAQLNNSLMHTWARSDAQGGVRRPSGGCHTLTRSGGLGGDIFGQGQRLVWGSPRGGFRGAEPPDAGKILKNFYKKPNEKLQF